MKILHYKIQNKKKKYKIKRILHKHKRIFFFILGPLDETLRLFKKTLETPYINANANLNIIIVSTLLWIKYK